MAKWKDITSYSQSEQERIPRSWEIKAGELRIVVTRILHLEGWYLTCEPFFYQNGMHATEIEDAKMEALDRVTEKIVTCEREVMAHKQDAL